MNLDFLSNFFYTGLFDRLPPTNWLLLPSVLYRNLWSNNVVNIEYYGLTLCMVVNNVIRKHAIRLNDKIINIVVKSTMHFFYKQETRLTKNNLFVLCQHKYTEMII